MRKWLPWDETELGYEAFIDRRQVTLPIPTCSWSFMVCLHEIGHVSVGDRVYGHLAEYAAEQWAIKRAAESYGIVDLDYIKDAKQYVWMHIISDVFHRNLQVSKIKPYVLKWVGATPKHVDLDVKVYATLNARNSLILS